MSATVAAALKKIAVAILTDKDTFKKVCTFIASIFVGLIMPLAAMLALFQGDIEFTPEMLEEIAADIDPEELEKLTKVQETVDSIDLAMDEAGMSERAEEAEILYMLALYDCSDEEDFGGVEGKKSGPCRNKKTNRRALRGDALCLCFWRDFNHRWVI